MPNIAERCFVKLYLTSQRDDNQVVRPAGLPQRMHRPTDSRPVMPVYEIDPTTDERWDSFLESHPQASIFHTGGWLNALRRTYGYTPVVFTTSPPAVPISNGIPFCHVSSWISGCRLVSLPFSDHCTPLVENSAQLTYLLTYLQNKVAVDGWRYIEIRPTTSVASCCPAFETSKIFCFHRLDLHPSLDEISRRFHKDCVKRKIQRAARERLVCEKGTSDSLLDKFYSLLLMTRRRHRLLAQPTNWFRNLIACLGEQVNIRVASTNGQPVASILTLRYKKALVYKYGCSDQKFNMLGGMQMLLWNAIQEAKESNLSEFDLGRTDCDAPGLLAFKERWGATRTELTYLRYPLEHSRGILHTGQEFLGKHLWSHAPGEVLAAAGRVLYKHMG